MRHDFAQRVLIVKGYEATIRYLTHERHEGRLTEEQYQDATATARKNEARSLASVELNDTQIEPADFGL